jgi:integrase
MGAGLRAAELCQLRWAQIDLRHGFGTLLWVLAVATTPVELIASAAWSAFIAFELFKLALPSFEHLTNSPPLPTL